MMEPQRPKVDRAVLAFVRTEALHPADFRIRENGTVRLNPGLTRQVTRVAWGQMLRSLADETVLQKKANGP